MAESPLTDPLGSTEGDHVVGEAAHPAERYHAGPSRRIALVQCRQLHYIAACNQIEVPADCTGAPLIAHLLGHGVDLSDELQDTAHEPKTLQTLPTEILRHIMPFAVGLGHLDPPTILARIFGSNERYLTRTGVIIPTRASKDLHEAALSVLLLNDTVVFQAGECPEGEHRIQRARYLTEYTEEDKCSYLKKIRHMELESGDLRRTQDEMREDTLGTIPQILKVCPSLDSLVVPVPYVLERLHNEWEYESMTSEDDHTATKDDILHLANVLRKLNIRKVVLGLDWWPDYNELLDDMISFKIDCSAKEYKEAAMATYDDCFGAKLPDQRFGPWYKRTDLNL